MKSVTNTCEHCGKRFTTEFETAEDLEQINIDGWRCQHCAGIHKNIVMGLMRLKMDDIHLTKKDFRVEWFSGTGPGGQNRNKCQNCCRIIHIESGLKAQATENRERSANQRAAFNRLAKMIVNRYMQDEPKPEIETTVIRNYNESRNEVHDKVSGLKLPYKTVINDLSGMIDARNEAMNVKI